MIHVSNHHIEFAYELIGVLPYAYKLHLDGKLASTDSNPWMEPFYWFSPKHTAIEGMRLWVNVQKATQAGIPNLHVTQPTLDLKHFCPPPLQARYTNSRFLYDKPLVCIYNRTQTEYHRCGRPLGVVNFFDQPCLKQLFTLLRHKYQVIYFNILGRPELYDGDPAINTGDMAVAKAFNIPTIHDVCAANPDLTFNEVQLMLMANCKRFVNVASGSSVLASYMGGTNVMYANRASSLACLNWYHVFGWSRTVFVQSYEALFEAASKL